MLPRKVESELNSTLLGPWRLIAWIMQKFMKKIENERKNRLEFVVKIEKLWFCSWVLGGSQVRILATLFFFDCLPNNIIHCLPLVLLTYFLCCCMFSRTAFIFNWLAAVLNKIWFNRLLISSEFNRFCKLCEKKAIKLVRNIKGVSLLMIIISLHCDYFYF